MGVETYLFPHILAYYVLTYYVTYYVLTHYVSSNVLILPLHSFLCASAPIHDFFPGCVYSLGSLESSGFWALLHRDLMQMVGPEWLEVKMKFGLSPHLSDPKRTNLKGNEEDPYLSLNKPEGAAPICKNHTEKEIPFLPLTAYSFIHSSKKHFIEKPLSASYSVGHLGNKSKYSTVPALRSPESLVPLSQGWLFSVGPQDPTFASRASSDTPGCWLICILQKFIC